MPELPEVQTIVSHLTEHLPGRQIKSTEIITPQILQGDSGFFRRTLSDASIKNISRYGKYIFLSLANGQTIVIHLRMTGQLFLAPQAFRPDKHTHIMIHFVDFSERLIFRDTRKFGRWELIKTTDYEQYLEHKRLGTDALQISCDEFCSQLKSHKKVLKAFLLDQSLIAGIGNIYADESLWRARLHPLRGAHTLTTAEGKSLYQQIGVILLAAVRARGTSVTDYIQSFGKKGEFQTQLKVYKQTGKPCYACGTPIAKSRVAGRGTHICPQCQKL